MASFTRPGATDYGDLGGTSMAAPMVAGVASLMWTVNNGLSAADIIALLRSSARIIPYKMKVTDKGTGVVT
jgi:subtilisin family serine protease